MSSNPCESSDLVDDVDADRPLSSHKVNTKVLGDLATLGRSWL